MRRTVLFLSCAILLAAGPAYSADDPLSRAMKLLEKRHYDEAAAALRPNLASIESAMQGAAYLTLGTAYLRNAELHRELYQSSLAITTDYLKKLAAGRGKSRSRFVDLYLGEALAETGKPETALIYLEKFIGEDGVEPKYKAVAKALQGYCYFARNDKQKADEVWRGIDTADPEVKTELAAAYSRAGLNDRNPMSLCEEGLAEMKKTRKPLSMRAVKNALGVYVRAERSDKGMDLVRRADLKAATYGEHISKSKVVTFYDLSLLSDLSALFLQESIASLEKAAADVKYKDTANYYLGEALALSGNVEQSAKVTASFISSAQMPQKYRDKATVRQAANQYQRGRQFDAFGAWDELSRRQPEDPDLLAEILAACGRLRIDCPKVAQKAAASVETGEGKRFSVLNIALGRYYCAKKDYARTASYLEAGRDKSNKNKIESNEPLMLVDLADAYYRTKKFSEALEIYFEMSKQFPEVRQIQEALQGIYSMEHKSAGDVKIF